MPANEKTLSETLKEVVGETIDTSKTSLKDTSKGISEGNSSETQSGGTAEYVSGIDISDIPEQDRPKFREKLSQKASLLEKGYQTKYSEVAKFKKAQEDILSQGITVDEAAEAVNRYIEQKRKPLTNTERKETIKLLDKLREQAPYDQRQAFDQMEQIIQEVTEIAQLRKDMKEMQNILGVVGQSVSDGRRKELTAEIEVLSNEYGKDFIEKHRAILMERGMQYKLPAEEILFKEVPPSELKEAVLARGNKKVLTKEKKEGISSSGTGITSSVETIDTKNNSLKDILKSVISQKK